MTALLDLAPSLVRDHWGLTSTGVAALPTGMNSATCQVDTAAGRFVLKAVQSRDAAALRSGAEAASRVDHPGLRCGPPLPTTNHTLTASIDTGEAALLRFVEGTPFTGESLTERAQMGTALRLVHERAPARPEAPTEFFGWMRGAAAAHPVEPWVSPTVDRVREAFDATTELGWSLLHTDPAPEAFLAAEERPTGLIDWTGAVEGPRLYDLASAVMYVGGRRHATALIDAYLRDDRSLRREVDDHLDLLLALRHAVQAAYFAQRLAQRDLTGLSDQTQNVQGLHFARDRLRDAGWLST